jgi:pyruvate dehydrogenase E2 component (dihydrolipoamide acetyltransferase)/2-oxoisovalerate dehydrogenase E2 component (dihydrolipoyl transacylase)
MTMDFRLPELGEGVYEAELVNWLIKPGDAVRRGQPLMEVMTDKATMEVPSPFAGTAATLISQPGQRIKVGDVVLTYKAAGEAAETAPAKAAEKAVKAAAASPARSAPSTAPIITANGPNGLTSRPGLPAKASPSVRYLARKLGLDLARIRGTGPDGRILIEDLSKAIPAAGKSIAVEPAADYGKPGTRIKLIGVRRKIAEHMVEAKRTIPHYAYVDECDVTELVSLRMQLKDRFERVGTKLTYLAFIVKATANALRQVPIVNSSLDEEAGEIALHDGCHIGIAVATANGLIVPVIRDADQKDLVQIAREIDRLSRDARAGKTKLEDLRGGTFTVTSIGNVGGLISTPVINHPEAAIVGVGKIIKRPVYDAAGNIRPAQLLYLSFSFDHRILDGAIGAAFGNAIIEQLQSPAALLLPRLV